MKLFCFKHISTLNRSITMIGSVVAYQEKLMVSIGEANNYYGGRCARQQAVINISVPPTINRFLS